MFICISQTVIDDSNLIFCFLIGRMSSESKAGNVKRSGNVYCFLSAAQTLIDSSPRGLIRSGDNALYGQCSVITVSSESYNVRLSVEYRYSRRFNPEFGMGRFAGLSGTTLSAYTFYRALLTSCRMSSVEFVLQLHILMFKSLQKI